LVERRDLDLRPQRDAVAAYFGLHPSHLASIAPHLLQLMALRVQGDRRHWLERVAALTTRRHPATTGL
jgi:hypothetical protein